MRCRRGLGAWRGLGHSHAEQQLVQPYRQTDGHRMGVLEFYHPAEPPTLTWQAVPMASDVVHSQQRHGSGHQHPHHRCPCHGRERLEGRLSWKRAEQIEPLGRGR